MKGQYWTSWRTSFRGSSKVTPPLWRKIRPLYVYLSHDKANFHNYGCSFLALFWCQQIADPSTSPKKLVSAKITLIEKEILQNALAVVQEIKSEIPSLASSPCSGDYKPTLK